MKDILKHILIVIFSVGWLVPLRISAYFYLGFIGGELRPYIMGKEFSQNSVPFVEIAMEAFTISLIWLSMVIIFWIWNITDKR